MTNDAQRSDAEAPVAPVVVVTGMSGAGKSTALNALEDVGYLAIDNAPPTVWRDLAGRASDAGVERLAIGLDIRARVFLDDAPAAIAALRADPGAHVLFLDADDAVLVRRFNFTRRTHPFGERSLTSDLAAERSALEPLARLADERIDTGAMTARDLTQRIWRRFASGEAFHLRLLSFGFKRGAPTDADVVLDVRGLSNPYYDPELRPRPGTDEAVQAYVFDARGRDLYGALRDSAARFATLARDAGRSSYTIAVGCTGGQHRSVAVTERLSHDLADRLRIEIEHRDLEAALADHGAAETAPDAGAQR